MVSARFGSVLALGCMTLLLGCGLDGHAPAAVGEVRVGVSGAGLSASDVAEVAVTITGAGISGSIVETLVASGDHWEGIIGAIPAGSDRTFGAQATSASGELLYEGEAAGVEIRRATTAYVAIVLQQVNPPPPFANVAPVIDALVASSDGVAPGESVALELRAHDANGDALGFAWSSSAGAFDDSSSASPRWTAPDTEGVETLVGTVTDSLGTATSIELAVQVAASLGRGKASIEARVNTWPEIAGLAASPGRIDAGESTALDLSASDADGDALAFAWSSDCAGAFDDASAEDCVFTLAAVPAGGSCTLTCLVTDGRGGANTASVTLQAGPAPAPDLAPQVTATFQSAAEGRPGDGLVLRVEAVDPEGTALSFAWSAGAGALGAQTDTGTGSEVTWALPGCAGITPVRATATVSDATGASTEVLFDARCVCDPAAGDACSCPNPTFTRAALPTGSAPQGVVIADLDGDGALDLADTGGGAVNVRLGNGDGTFGPAAVYPASVPWTVTAGDLDGDARVDLVTSGYAWSVASLLFGNGDGTFQPKVDLGGAGRVISTGIGDLDGDGHADLVTAAYTEGQLFVRLGRGDRTFDTGVAYTVGREPISVALDDLDGDGDLDVACGQWGGGVNVLLGAGDGTLIPSDVIPTDGQGYGTTTADMDRDGNRDVVAVTVQGMVGVALGRGDGTFDPPVRYGTGPAPYLVATGDVDGDGLQDVAVTHTRAATVGVFRGTGGGALGARLDVPTGSGPYGIAMADLDGNRLTDIVATDSGDGTLSILLASCPP